MNLLYDLTAAQSNEGSEFHGGGKYAKKVLFAVFSSSHFKNWEVFGLYDSKKKLDPDIEIELVKRNIKLIDTNNTTISDVVNNYSIDRIYSALPSSFFDNYHLACPFYSTIHGLRFIEITAKLDSLKYYLKNSDKLKALGRILFSNYVKKKYTNYYKNLLLNSSVITVSNHTKYSILSFFPKINNDIPVFYSPDVTEFESTIANEKEKLDTSDYYLLVSSNRWIKNNLRSVIALDEIFSEHKEIKQNVILTGVTDPQVFLKHIKNKERFIFYKYISEGFLSILYKNAFAFLYMSLNEGFGYPPLDAMKNGVPVITSPFTSIPEVCGEAVLYSNPYSIPEIKSRILQLNDKQVYQQLKEDGSKRYNIIKKKQDADLLLMTDLILGINKTS